jgi:hypothetical protein
MQIMEGKHMETVNEHAKALSRLGASKGGRARKAALNPEQRQDIARRAALARWGDGERGKLPKATHAGPLTIGGKVILAAVLETRKRVLTQESFLQALGRAGKAAGGTGSSLLVEGLPPFLAAQNLKPFISEDLLKSTTPVVFRTPNGGRAFGYEAELLPKVCEVYLQARDAKALLAQQKHVAKACDILMRGLAQVGIIALVDEATGYQQDRARDELNRILEAYISQELRPWTRRFPDEFFKQIYRLHGWEYREGHHKRPRHVGKLVNQLIYDKLPVGVLPDLKRKNPPINEAGYRRWRHHQFLTAETGEPHLDKQIIEVTTLMRVADDKKAFERLFNKAFPRMPHQLVMESVLADEKEDD